jgi:hypothetical protein
VGCEEPLKAKQVPRKLVLFYLNINFSPISRLWKDGSLPQGDEIIIVDNRANVDRLLGAV